LSSSFKDPGDFALATLDGGLVIIDAHGKRKETITKSCGLQDDNVKYIFEDFQGNLWLGLNEGIARIEYASPLSIYDDRSNLPGLVMSVINHGPGKNLYAGTTSGLYLLTPPGKFQPVPGITGTCWSLLSVEDSLIAATTSGVFQVANGNNQGKVIENLAYALLRSPKHPERIWVGTREGLISLFQESKTGYQETKGKWVKEHQFARISQELRTIVEDQKGNLWLGTLTNGVLKIAFPGEESIINPKISRYYTDHGLPPGEVNVFWAAGQVRFASITKGMYRFDEEKERFIPDLIFGDEFGGGSRGVFRIAEDKHQNIWFHSRLRNFLAIHRQDGTFVIDSKPFLRLPDDQVNAIYPGPGDNAAWFASHSGLIRYDTTIKKNYDLNFNAIIREVWVIGKQVFGGYQDNTNHDSKNLIPIIAYKDRKNFRFEFAAPFFEAETTTQYRYLLEEHDDHWSDWNSESSKDFTILDSGVYTLRVQGKNVYGNLSSETRFPFKILPPWYKTWWAFSLYAALAFLLMFFVVKWRSGKLEREKRKLEQIVQERTRELEKRTQEINEKNSQLETQTVQLKEQSEKLKEMDKVKSRFFANISHEFRTPLTLIMGPLEQMLHDGGGDKQKKKLNLMLRNSQRLLGLINQLLELSKFEGGKVKLQAALQDIIPFLRGIVASFESLAEQHELELVFHAGEEAILLYLDARKLEDVMINLLINAVKFTPPGGKITMAVKSVPVKNEKFPSGSMQISICDTGPGIPREQLAHIFDRFFQSPSTFEPQAKGSGIGLALVKELVQLHHGTIDVNSRAGKGTEFIVTLPMGDAHLSPEEIATPKARVDFKPAGPVEIGLQAPPEDVDDAAMTGMDIDNQRQGKEIILVVEDSGDMRDYIKGTLEPHYAVVEAADGQEGIEKAQEIIPDLIISDIMMPVRDGYELCGTLKKDIKTSHIPIILLTAKASEESTVQGLETGADDYVTKPFSTQILLARIKNLIDLRRQLQLTIDREMTFQPAKISVSPIDKEFMQELQKVIKTNLSEPDFNVEQLAKKLYMGRTTIYRKILAITGETPTDFIRSCRLKRGAELLKSNYGTVLEVALEVGFSNTSYFTKCFKNKFHQLPSTYQAAEAD
jgi:signal transduction histidine kinase/DNA-binding response OmpR family regulator